MPPLYHLFSSSTASTQPSWSDFEGDDDGHHIVAADSAVTAAAATIIIVSISISGSDDIEMTISNGLHQLRKAYEEDDDEKKTAAAMPRKRITPPLTDNNLRWYLINKRQLA
ncbi:hypothetical protein LSAT2_025021 [Lamellibrachia satsuma]|nr:hypothetical protein LSAT2_025021 [Lamellibrachia satsuma]